jgi:hypothetical protein
MPHQIRNDTVVIEQRVVDVEQVDNRRRHEAISRSMRPRTTAASVLGDSGRTTWRETRPPGLAV